MGLFGKLLGLGDYSDNHKGMTIDAGDAHIYRDSDCFGSGKTQYFGHDPIYIVLAEMPTSYMVRHHSLSDGITGFFKKKDVVEL